MPVQLNARRRWFGLLYLSVSAGMVIWGFTWLEPLLRGWWFVGYWTVCAVLALLALGIAWLDWRSLRRQLRAEQQAWLHPEDGEVPHARTEHRAPRLRSPSPTAPPHSS